MLRQPTFSTNKIMFSVFFIASVLISSVVIFHARQKSSPPIITAEQGLLFPVAREIKAFELQTKTQTAFTRQQLLHHWTLLFFGFTHCASICPTTLDVLDRAYTKLHGLYPDLQVLFVSLDSERDTSEIVANYVQRFNPAFIGGTGKIHEIRKLQAQFGIYSERDHSGPNYQIQHTPTLLLINPDGKWAGTLKYNLTPESLTEAIANSVKALA